MTEAEGSGEYKPAFYTYDSELESPPPAQLFLKIKKSNWQSVAQKVATVINEKSVMKNKKEDFISWKGSFYCEKDHKFYAKPKFSINAGVGFSFLAFWVMVFVGATGALRSHYATLVSLGPNGNYIAVEPLLMITPFVLAVFCYYFYARRNLSDGMGAIALFALAWLLFGFVFAGPLFLIVPIVIFFAAGFGYAHIVPRDWISWAEVHDGKEFVYLELTDASSTWLEEFANQLGLAYEVESDGVRIIL